MKRVIALSLICSLLFQTVSPALAQTTAQRRAVERQCPVQYMLYHGQASEWLELECLYRVITHVQMAKGKYQKDETVVYNVTVASNRITTHFGWLLRHNHRKTADQFQSAINTLAELFGVKDIGVVEYDSKGNEIRGEENDGKTQKGADNSGGAGIGTFNAFSGAVNTDTEMEAKILRLSHLKKGDLIAAIDVMAAKGSDKPGEPEYIHPAIINSAFMFLADKVKPTEKGLITKYLNDKYPKWVSSAAANALQGYAKGDHNPEGKFELNKSETNSLMSFAAVSLLAVPKSMVTGISFEAFRSMALAALTEAGVALEAAGPLCLFLAGGWLIVAQLNSSYEPITTKNWADTRAIFWDKVWSANAVEIDTGEDEYNRWLEEEAERARQEWEDDERDREKKRQQEELEMAVYGASILNLTFWALYFVASESSSEEEGVPVCEFRRADFSLWRLTDLHNHIDWSDDASEDQLKRLHRCLSQAKICRKSSKAGLFSGCQALSLRELKEKNLSCAADINQLYEVNKVASSFYDSVTDKKLRVEARFVANESFDGAGTVGKSGRWVPTATIWDSRKESLDDILEELVGDKKLNSSNLRTRTRVNDYTVLLYDDVDRQGERIRIDKYNSYPEKNPYICEHSVKYNQK